MVSLMGLDVFLLQRPTLKTTTIVCFSSYCEEWFNTLLESLSDLTLMTLDIIEF
jgi:hypothetical protein